MASQKKRKIPTDGEKRDANSLWHSFTDIVVNLYEQACQTCKPCSNPESIADQKRLYMLWQYNSCMIGVMRDKKLEDLIRKSIALFYCLSQPRGKICINYMECYNIKNLCTMGRIDIYTYLLECFKQIKNEAMKQYDCLFQWYTRENLLQFTAFSFTSKFLFYFCILASMIRPTTCNNKP